MIKKILGSPLWSGISAIVAIVALYLSVIGLPPSKDTACGRLFGEPTTLNEQYTDTGNNKSQSWPLVITDTKGNKKSGEFSGWFAANPDSGDGWGVTGKYTRNQYEVTKVSANGDIVKGSGVCVGDTTEGVKKYTKKVNSTPHNEYNVKIR